MWSAFVLVVAPPAGEADELPRAPVGRAAPGGLGFAPGGDLARTDLALGASIGVWWAPGDDRTLVQVPDAVGGFVVRCGQLRWGRRAWDRLDEFVDQDTTPGWVTRLGERIGTLDGIFALLAHEPGRAVLASTDPLGYAPLFMGERRGTVAVGTRPSLVAAAIAPPRVPPPRDVHGCAWLAHAGLRLGEGTGFADVEMLPRGALVWVEAGGAVRVDEPPPPWRPPDAMTALSRDEVIDRIEVEIADGLHAAAADPDRPVVMDLTGGRDSRLLLAVAQRAELASSWRYRTVGPPDLADVQVATQIAERYGLDHRAEFLSSTPRAPHGDSPAERSRCFVATTEGLANLWEQRAAVPDQSLRRIGGLFPMLLRTPLGGRVALESLEGFADTYPAQLAFGRLGLVLPEVAEALDRQLAQMVFEDVAGGATPLDLVHRYKMGHSQRQHGGPFQDLDQQPRVAPLYTARLAQLGVALGGAARRDELAHRVLIGRGAPGLAELPFAGSGWPRSKLSEDLSVTGGQPEVDEEHLGDLVARFVAWRRPDRPPVASLATGGGADPGREALVARFRRRGTDRYRAVLSEAFADRDSAVWEVVDRARALEALDLFDQLPVRARKELFGAATMALWMEGSPLP
jgi:hypothetical protein